MTDLVVVVLEDEPADQRFMIAAIQGSAVADNIELVLCPDYASAKEAVSRPDLSLAIVDLSVPGGDGIGIIRRVREQNTLTPAVVLTSSTAKWDHEAALEAGARAVHTKPFGWSDYRATVQSILDYWLGLSAVSAR